MSGSSTGSSTGADQVSDSLAAPDGAPWDLLVVGGGTAGLVAARTAATLGASVLLVERERTGGDCLWTGCVPSKSLLAAAHAAASARDAGRLGVHTGPVSVDFAQVMAHVRDAITTIEPVDSPASLREVGARVAHGEARFTGPSTVEVDGAPVRFRQAVVATGSRPAQPGIPGLSDADPLTSDTVWDLEELPPRLLVLGGGPIGCELGQAFARLGSQVTLVEAGPRLLSRESSDAADLVRRALTHDGVDLRTGHTLVHLARDGDALVGTLGDGSTVTVDRVLVATGRRPRTEGLHLDAAGVLLTAHGHVRVDAHLRTTARRIWAAGDVSGQPPFTHVASQHGSLAASNALLGLRRSVQPDQVPRVTFTHPEVAAFGRSTDDLRDGELVRRTGHDHVDRAVAEGSTNGHADLVLDRRGRVVGASIVGPRAGEVLAEVVLAGSTGAKARTLAGVMHAYPTWSYDVWNAALAQGRSDLESPVVARVTRGLAGARRRWVDLRARRGGTDDGAAGPRR